MCVDDAVLDELDVAVVVRVDGAVLLCVAVALVERLLVAEADAELVPEDI